MDKYPTKKSYLKHGVIVVAILFAIPNLYEGWRGFGRQSIDLSFVQYWIFSCWVAFRNIVGYTLLPVALVFAFGRLSRYALIPLFWFVYIVEIVSLYVESVFHASLATEWLPLLLNTSCHEVWQFVAMAMSPLVLLNVIVFLVFAVYGSFLLWKAKYPSPSRKSLCMAVICALPFVCFHCLLMNIHFGVNQTTYTNFIVSGVHEWTRGRGIRNACLTPNLPPSVGLEASLEEAPDCVFVLGESSTRNSWHLYGYPRMTTPHLDELCRYGNGGFRFSDVVGVIPATDRALALLLTDVTLETPDVGNWTVAEVFRRAGYHCVLISNQWDGRSCATTIDRIFNGCDKRVSVHKEFAKGDWLSCYDENVVPYLDRELRSPGGPKLVFVHLAGMHYPVQNVIPPEEAHYNNLVEPSVLAGLSDAKTDRINRYDDAILYEDKVLGAIVDVLKSHDRPVCLFFISDHGESPRADNWRVFTDRDVYEIPMVIWLSDKYRKLYPQILSKVEASVDRPCQSDELTYGLLELGRIRLEYDPSKSFLSHEFKGRNPRVIDKGRIVYDATHQ